VTQHLVADVPINAFLSGGLDSSLLVAMARKQLDRLDCYTIKFRDKDKKQEAMSDDAFYAAKVARNLNVHLNTIEVAPDVSSLLARIVHTLDEPIGDSAAINTQLICEAAGQRRQSPIVRHGRRRNVWRLPKASRQLDRCEVSLTAIAATRWRNRTTGEKPAGSIQWRRI